MGVPRNPYIASRQRQESGRIMDRQTLRATALLNAGRITKAEHERRLAEIKDRRRDA